jgi:hypothetical protein
MAASLKVNLQIEYIDGRWDNVDVYDIGDSEEVAGWNEQGFLLYSPQPVDDGLSYVLINLAATRKVTARAAPEPVEPEGAIPFVVG